MNAEKLTMDDGLMMRVLADSPGGLELHIGVRLPVATSIGNLNWQPQLATSVTLPTCSCSPALYHAPTQLYSPIYHISARIRVL
jgi:hypothetical protein